MKTTNTKQLAVSAFRKHKEVCESYDLYTGILTMHGMARLAVKTADPDLLSEIRSTLLPYVNGERDFFINFPNYLCGGNGTAWLFYQGHLPEAADAVRRYADQIMNEAPRNPNGILCHPRIPGQEAVFIDVSFAITPFLLYSGLALNNDDYIEEAFQQTAKMVQILRSDESGLLFQSRNINSPGHRSDDHWSRGNGWGAFSLAELAAHLPENHPRKAEAVALYQDHVVACAAFQNDSGLWHQEMTDMDRSYVETSGSGLMLYALGLGLEAGLVEKSEEDRLKKGLRGLLDYITEDTDIFHTCRGCLSPGEGTKLDYRAQPPVRNDQHAFGPVVFAFGQAHAIGIETISQ